MLHQPALSAHCRPQRHQAGVRHRPRPRSRDAAAHRPTIPTPDFIICDVGATVIVDGTTCNRCSRSSTTSTSCGPASVRWSRRWQRFRASSARMSPAARCRISAPLAKSRRASPEVAAAIGCDVLYSADRYLDILPRGPTGQPAQACGCAGHLAGRVLVAGDTLNDLRCTRPASGRLRGRIRSLRCWRRRATNRAFHARHTGCGGILEDHRPFQFHRRGGARGTAARSTRPASRSW